MLPMHLTFAVLHCGSAPACIQQTQLYSISAMCQLRMSVSLQQNENRTKLSLPNNTLPNHAPQQTLTRVDLDSECLLLDVTCDNVLCLHHSYLQITVQEIGGANCIVLQQDAALGSVSTIVLRGSTEGFLDDVERAVDDGINAYKVKIHY